MSFIVTKKGLKYFVENETTKKIIGWHLTEEKAKHQAETTNREEIGVRKELNAATRMFVATEPEGLVLSEEVGNK